MSSVTRRLEELEQRVLSDDDRQRLDVVHVYVSGGGKLELTGDEWIRYRAAHPGEFLTVMEVTDDE